MTKECPKHQVLTRTAWLAGRLAGTFWKSRGWVGLDGGGRGSSRPACGRTGRSGIAVNPGKSKLIQVGDGRIFRFEDYQTGIGLCRRLRGAWEFEAMIL
jgi:hypothetical protein